MHQDKRTAELELAKHIAAAAVPAAGDPAVPQAPAEAPAPLTVRDVAEEWLRTKEGKRVHYHYVSILKAQIYPSPSRRRGGFPGFGADTLIKAIGFRAIEAFKAARNGAITPCTINHHVGVIRSVLRYAWKAGLIDRVPEIAMFGSGDGVHVKPSEDFKYLRTEGEIRRFLTSAKKEGERVFALYATAVYTGMRQGELAGLRWEDIDFTHNQIRVRHSFAGPTKSHRVRTVTIVNVLRPILSAWKLRSKGDLVFPSRAKTMELPAGVIFQEVLKRVLVRAGFERDAITFHGLRHTFASHWMMSGGSKFKLQALLGHASVTMTERYSHLSPSAFAEDAAIFDHLGLRPADVTELRPVAGASS